MSSPRDERKALASREGLHTPTHVPALGFPLEKGQEAAGSPGQDGLPSPAKGSRTPLTSATARCPRLQQGVGGDDSRWRVFVAPEAGFRLQWDGVFRKGSSSAPRTGTEPTCLRSLPLSHGGCTQPLSAPPQKERKLFLFLPSRLEIFLKVTF